MGVGGSLSGLWVAQSSPGGYYALGIRRAAEGELDLQSNEGRVTRRSVLLDEKGGLAGRAGAGGLVVVCVCGGGGGGGITRQIGLTRAGGRYE